METPQDLINGILWYAVFLLSVTFHEFAHSWAAYKMGDMTAYNTGQVTMNPLPHIKREPVGTVVVPLLSYVWGGWMIGWASAPYNPVWAFRYPKKSAAMAAAGPLSNLVLVIISAALIHIGILLGIFTEPDSITIQRVTEAVNEGGAASFAAMFVSILFSLNLILFTFNLIPLPPLDGSSIIPLYLNDNTARKYMAFISKPFFYLIGIFAAWQLFGLIYWKIHLAFINLLYPYMSYQ